MFLKLKPYSFIFKVLPKTDKAFAEKTQLLQRYGLEM
jgi:hypothetical protein